MGSWCVLHAPPTRAGAEGRVGGKVPLLFLLVFDVGHGLLLGSCCHFRHCTLFGVSTFFGHVRGCWRGWAAEWVL